jgi:hypothetical protein
MKSGSPLSLSRASRVFSGAGGGKGAFETLFVALSRDASTGFLALTAGAAAATAAFPVGALLAGGCDVALEDAGAEEAGAEDAVEDGAAFEGSWIVLPAASSFWMV